MAWSKFKPIVPGDLQLSVLYKQFLEKAAFQNESLC